jgi:cell division protein FtsQ
MLQKGLRWLGYLLLVAFIVISLAFSFRESRNISCRNIQVEFRENELIKISEDEIIRMVKAADSEVIGKDLRQINAHSIEEEITKHQAILKAEVYKVIAKDSINYKGILGVRIRHREPVLRVMSSDGSYYIDKTGVKVPLSVSYAARVLVATGYFSEDFAREKLFPFVLFLNEDPFWNAQVEQVYVDQNSNVLLTPLFGDHIIELGTMEDFTEKLRNVKAFYEQVMMQNNWNKYEQISVKYRNQVIAKIK